MAVDERVQSLYNALKADGADVGTVEEFNEWFFKPGEEGYNNRKYVYDTFKADGADVGKDYNEFASWLNLAPVDKSQSGTTAPNAVQQQDAAAGSNATGSVGKLGSSALGGAVGAIQAGSAINGALQAGAIGGAIGALQAGGQQNGVVTGVVPASKTQQIEQPKQEEGQLSPKSQPRQAELSEKEIEENLAFMREANKSRGDISEAAPQVQSNTGYSIPKMDKAWKLGYSQSWGKIKGLFDGLDYEKKDVTADLDDAVKSRYDSMSDQAIESELQKLSKEYKAGQWEGDEDVLRSLISRLQFNLVAHEYGFKDFKDLLSRRGEAEFEMYKYHPAFEQEWLATYKGGPGENPLLNWGKEIVKKQLIEDTMNGVNRPAGYYHSLPFSNVEFSKRYASWALKRAKALGNMGFADVYNNGIKTWESYVRAGLLESGAEEAMAQGAGYRDVGVAGGKYNSDFDAAAATAWNMAEDEYRGLANIHNAEIWEDYATMGGGREARFMASGEAAVSNLADRLTSHDLDKMIDNAWNALGETKRKQIMLATSQNLMKQYPGADPAKVVKAAQAMVRQQTIQRVLDYAKKQNAPKNVIDYFAYKVVSQNSIIKIQEAVARSRAGSTGDWQVREQAMQEYGKNHRIAGVTGTVVGMGLDPATYISAGFGKGAATGAVKLVENIGAAAGRKWLTTTAGKVTIGAISGAANLGTYEGINEALSQLRWGGAQAVDLNTGLIKTTGYDVGKIGKAIFHGSTMGAGTGIVAPLMGNVWSPIMEATSSTAGKMAVKTGELFTGTIAEGTIFSIPDVYDAYAESEDIIKSFSDKKSRNYISDDQERAKAIAKVREKRNETMLDIWNESVATMAGFKAKHIAERLYEVSKSGNGRVGFETRLRYMLDRKPDLALTKDEQAELERGGYTDLKGLVDDYVAAEKNRRANSKPVVTGRPRTMELGTREEDMPYNRFVDLMNDGSISEAARAKMYYYITGHALPMSTVMYGQLTENKDRDGNVKGYTVQSIGANGVVTSREFTSRKRAENELQKVNRQIELNTIDIGERYNESIGNSTKELREDVGQKYGVDVEKALKKEPKRRSTGEQMALDEYMRRLFPEKEAREEDAEDVTFSEDTSVTDETTNGFSDEATNGFTDEPTDEPTDEGDAIVVETLNRTGEDGMVHPAVLKGEDESQVNIVSGNVVTLADGTIDVANSDQDIIIVDAKGQRLMININDIASIGTPIDPNAAMAAAEQANTGTANAAPGVPSGTGDTAVSQAANTAAVATGAPGATQGSATGIEVGGRYNVVDEQNTQHEVEVLRDNGNGTVEVRVDGAEDSMPMAKDQLAAMLGIDVESTTPQTEQPAATTKPLQEPVDQPAPVATNDMKQADVDAGENGVSLREKAAAYVDAYFPDVTGAEREGFIEQLVAQNDFENTVSADKADGVNLDRVAKYEQRIAELEKEHAAENVDEEPEELSTAVDKYRIADDADEKAIGMAGFTRDNIQATADYLNGKLGKREYLERLGFDKNVLAGVNDDKVDTWVDGVVNRASAFLTDKPAESDEVSGEYFYESGNTVNPVRYRQEVADMVGRLNQSNAKLLSEYEEKMNAAKDDSEADALGDELEEKLQLPPGAAVSWGWDGEKYHPTIDLATGAGNTVSFGYLQSLPTEYKIGDKIGFRYEDRAYNAEVTKTDANGKILEAKDEESGRVVVRDGKVLGANEIIAESEKEDNTTPTSQAQGDKVDRTTATIMAARNGDKEAQDKLSSYGIDWEKKPVVRFVSQGEVDSILAGERFNGRFNDGRVDVTNQTTPTTAANSEYRITYKDELDWALNKRLRMKNKDLGDGWIMDGYSLDDVQTIERRNPDGSYTVVYDANATAPEPMPMREVGKGKNKTTEPDWLAVTPERGHDWLFNEIGLDSADANDIVNANLEAAKKGVEKASKQKPKKTTNPLVLQSERERIKGEQEAAQAVLDYWNKVKAIEADRQAQTAAERKAKDAEVAAQAQAEEQARQAAELAKQQEQAERGAGAVHPAIAEKWNNAPKIEGYKDEVVLANGERVPGTYYLVESGAVTPSHNASREFEKYEGFPVDENGNTINDRDYERDKDAQNITRSIADKYDSRALQTPVIVSKDGVVLSGNGRTMAGELAASNNTDGAYIEHLKNYGRKYGFSPEQVSSMQHPRAVFVPDADMPYTTETFAKFNAQEMKGQSKTEQAVKLGKVVDDATFNQIVRAINDHETLGDFYNNTRAATEAINALRNAGALNNMQYAEMFDGDAVSSTGRQIIENMLIGKAFEGNPDVIRQLTEIKSLRQSVVTALSEITTNKALGKDYSLENELAQAVDLAYKARKAGFKENERVSPYATQLNLFPFEDGETVADYNNVAVLELADLMNDKRPTRLKTKLQDYNQQSAESAAGQMDIFSGGVKEKKEIIKTALKTLHNGETEETSRPEQRGPVADERGGEASLQENGAVDTGSASLATPQAEPSIDAAIVEAGKETNTEPTDAQKEAGNYKKGHVKIDGFDVSIEQPKGSVRSGVDATGKAWSQKMNNTYGYIRGTEGVDGDHIDVFFSDNLDGWNGTVYVVDQVNKDGSFDEHKVMYGFNSEEEARKAYLSNYEKGWQGLGAITPVSKEEFKKWVDSSHRKTKPFAEYKNVKVESTQPIADEKDRQSPTLFDEKSEKSLEEAKNEWENLCKPKEIVNFANDEAAQEKWVGEHLNEIVDKYIAANGNKLDPDEMRRSFAGMGYDGKNVEEYRVQEGIVVGIIYDKMLENAVASGNTSITLLTGVGGAGKSVATRKMKDELDKRGLVYDSAFNKYNKLDKAIKRAKELGMTDVQVIAVHNDALTAFGNTVNRGLQTGRFLALDYFLNDAFYNNQGKIAELQSKHPDVDIVCYDNSGNKGGDRPNGGRVSVEEATKWDYTVTDELLNNLLDIIENGLNERRFKPNEIAIIGRRLPDVARRIAEPSVHTTERIDRLGQRIRQESVGDLQPEAPREQPVVRRDRLGATVDGGRKGEPGEVEPSEQDANAPLSLTDLREIDEGTQSLNLFDETNIGDVFVNDSGLTATVDRKVDSKKNKGVRLICVQARENGQDGRFIKIFNPLHLKRWLDENSMSKKGEAKSQESEVEFEEIPNESAKGEQPKSKKKAKSDYGSKNKGVSRDRYEKLKERMRKKLGGQMNMGVDPEILAIGTEMAAYHIEAGARKFADFAKRMIEDLGDVIRPYLKSFYNGARDLPEMSEWEPELTPYDEVRKFDVANFDKKTVDAMATADHVIKEQQAAKDAEVATAKIKETRQSNKKAAEQQGSLFGDLFGEEAALVTQQTEPKASKPAAPKAEQPAKPKAEQPIKKEQPKQDKDENVNLQAGSKEARGERRQPQQNEPLGEGSRNEVERPDGRGMGGRSESHPGDTSSRSGGLSRPSESEQRIAEPAVKKNTHNNRVERGKDYAPKDVDARIEANIAAIELMQKLIDSGKKATAKDMAVLRKFSGWGGLGKAFNESGYSYNPTARRLRELLGNEAYEQAVMSRNSAYFTPARIIDTMWDIARAMGFTGGSMVEGSAGIGNIIGLMPTDLSERTNILAVEIDQTTGNILKLLYPDAQVMIQGFETTKIPNGSVDLSITNVPFVTGLRVMDTSGDKDLSQKFHDIHDFCIAKNVRKLREGGIGIFITSSGTLDNSQKLRNWLVGEGNADVVGAFRLNNTTFGGTGATSDIIVVKKRVNGQKSPHAIDVLRTTGVRNAVYKTGDTKKVNGKWVDETKPYSMEYNEYFVEHPEMMGGEMKFGFEQGDTYRPGSKALYPKRGINQNDRLAEFVKSMAEKDWSSDVAPTTQQSDQPKVYEELGEGIKEGSMLIDKNGDLCVASYGRAVPLDVNNNKVKGRTKQQCFKDYSAIKDAVQAVLEYQTNNSDDAGLKPLIANLNKVYDNFVNTYGHFHKNPAISFLRNDMDYSSIAALETMKESNDANGKRVQSFKKGDIFTKRVVEPETEPKPTNVKDGIITSIYKHGRIDIPYISEQLGKTPEAVKKEIINSGLGFENPLSREVEVSYEYLSGNVRDKLRQAQEQNENGEYDVNIKALEKVIPMNIPAHLIEFSLGSSWLDPKVYELYIKNRTDLDIPVRNIGGTWVINEPYYTAKEKNRAMGVHSEKLDKTIMGHELIAAAMQNKTVRVTKSQKLRNGKTETLVDQEATQACAAKIDEIRQDFKDWAREKMQSDPELSQQVEEAYNEQFNNYVPKEIPDEFVPEHFSGATQNITLRPHQAKAAIRATTQPLMLAHEVGSGKSFTLITTAMEMRRLGTARKPMVVVQNATLAQFVADAKLLYPNAKILSLEDSDRNAEGRKAFYAKIKYNDWDMIVVPQSAFEMIPDSEERQMAFVKDKIQEKMQVLEQLREAGATNFETKQAEKEISKLEDELSMISSAKAAKRKEKDAKKEAIAKQNADVKAREMLDRKVDDVEDFDEMGIDAILVDEAHEYKHLGFATAMQRGVKGVDPSYSKKAQGVYLKTQSVMERTGGKNVVFATGTPISNTAAEVWTFMRYLMPADVMKSYDIYYFDDFVRNFGNLTQMLEFTTSGKFKENNRFAGYVNLPELVRIWFSVADTVRSSDVGSLMAKIPAMEGDKAQDIYLPQTPALRSVMKYVKARLREYDNMSGKEKKANSHIPLTMYGIAKAAAVDARLVMNDAPDDPNSKTNEAVRQTMRSLKETAKYKGTVAIFADNYQNKDSGFNIYEDIKKKLVAEGVPENQVVVIKSGMSIKKKQEIFDKVNAGDIRVIMGSTFTLGTGVNIQERLHTLIHLDAPNRPMDYTQRNGRILRQGNLHKEWGLPVRVLRFGVEDSLDVTAYQRLKTKGAIVESIMNGKQLMGNSMENRTMEEEEDAFGDTVAQLSGSEYAMLKQQAEREVRKLIAKKKQHEADQVYIHNQKPRLEGQIATAKKRMEQAKKSLELVKDVPENPVITINKVKYPSVDAMADYIKAYNKKVAEAADRVRNSYMDSSEKRDLTMNIGGFDFDVSTVITKDTERTGTTLSYVARRVMTYSCEALGLENVPVKQALLRNAIEDIITNVLTGKDFKERIESSERRITNNESEIKQLNSREGKPFEFDKELAEAEARLADYEEKMKAELEAKEAKYAEMDADIDEASSVDYTDEEDESVANEDAVPYGISQGFGSAGTSLNQVPSATRKIKWEPGTVNVDIGGGRFDKATNYLEEKGVENLVFDPFNRNSEHNKAVAERVRDEKVDTVTCNNVLNVIDSEQSRANVILQAAKALRKGGTAYFSVYEGDKSGVGRQTKSDSWQNNRPTRDYVPEIEQYFEDVSLKNGVITARNPIPTDELSVWDFDGQYSGNGIAFERGSSYRNGNGDVIRFESHAEQMSLFGVEQSNNQAVEQSKRVETVKRAQEMSDAELLKEMGRDIAELEKAGRADWGVQTLYSDEYDRRHIKEYNQECDAVRRMLEENNVGIEEAEQMLLDTIFTWRDGFATPDRTKLLAQFDTLNDYYAEKEDERDNADLYQEVEVEQAETPTTPQEVALPTQQAEPAKPKKAGFNPADIKLRKLKSGETCYVERRYQESGGFDFTGSEVVESDADLAYIFRNLENSAIENTFLVLIKDGKATILHTGMGSYSSAVGHTGAGMLAASQLKPQHVIMVHNHPSGNLTPSMQDVDLQKRVKRMFGENVVREAIIIDITSGEYSVFDTDNTRGTIKHRPTSAKNEIPYKTYSFSQYVFNKDYKPGSTMQVTDANKAAAFISSHRLGERDKLSLVVMNRTKHVTGNVFLPWTTLDDVDITKAANKIATYIHQMGGESGIIYGSGTIDRSKLGPLSREIEKHEVRLDDFINVEGVSAQVQGVLEPEVEYEAMPRNTEQPTEVAEDSVGYGDTDDSGISDEELDAYDAGRYSFAESVTQGLVDLATKNANDYQLRINAMREFGGNLTKLRKIMDKQKAYDKATVDDIVRLARMVMGNGFFKNMSAYEVKRLLAAIKKGVGAENLTPIANNVVDMLVSHQLRESKAALAKLMQIKGRKVDARGIEVQAGLDIDGQRMMSALKDGMSLGENGLSTRINDCENRLDSQDEIVKKNAVSEYQGLMLAKDYHDNILSGEEEEILLREEKRQEEEKIYDFRRDPVLDDDGNAIINLGGSVRTVERKTLKPEFKTNVTEENKRKRKDVEAAIEKIEQSIRESRMERVTAYSDFISDVVGDVRASRERAAAWRDEQLRRVEEIHHNANSDLQGIDPKSQTKEKKFVPIFNPKNDLVRGLFMPLATFEKFMRFFGRRFHNGEGYLFDRYVRGMIDCEDKEWRSKHAAHEELDAKVKEVFEGKAKRWSDLFELERKKKYPTIPVEYWDNGERVRESLSQGEALSLYVWSKQKDAEAGLRRMGISEEDMETLRGQLDPKFVELADWVVSDFLPKRREYYNEVYERMFGAPMAAIENYFPIVRNSRDVEKPTDVAERDQKSTNASTITGSFIKRVRTAAALDIHTDFFDLLLKHLDDMEHIAAWAEFNRDLNTLRNYKRFKNRVSNMNSFEFGAGKDLWKAFDNCCAIVTGVYEGNAKSKLDKITLNINKGFTRGAIAFRINTALKQYLSLPAFWSDARIDDLVKYQTPIGNAIVWGWAMENVPGLSKRWQSRQVGDTRLMDTDLDWKLWRNKYMKYLERGGMWSNALVDSATCASGAKAVYETKKRRYLKIGYTEEQAEKKALQDAAIAYKGSQQESMGGFVSEMQVDRTFLNNMLTVFRNSPFSYGRKMTTGLRELKKRMRPGYKSDFIEAETTKMVREGIPEENAKKEARRLYRFGGLHALFDVFNYGYLLSFLWTVLGGSAWYLLFGEDDEKKEEIIKDGARRLWFSPLEGFTGGNTFADKGSLLLKYATDEDGAEKALQDFVNWSWFTTPMEGETDNFLRDVRFDEQKALWDVFSLAIQSNLGFKPETFTDGVAAIVDYCDGDPQTSKEALLCWMRVMQVPQSQTDNVYIDELGMTAKDAQKLNAMEMADRYAKYKRRKNDPLSYITHSEDEQNIYEKYRKRFLDNMKERMMKMDEEQLTWNFDNPNDSERRKAVGKVYSKQNDVKGSAWNKPAKNWKPETRRAHLKYQRYQTWEDLAEDTMLDLLIQQAENRGDNETAKALRDGKKKLTEIKHGKHTKTIDIYGLGEGSAEEDKAIMEKLRSARKELIEEYGGY